MKVNVAVRLILIYLGLFIGFSFSQVEASDTKLIASASLMYLTRGDNDSYTIVKDNGSRNELLNSSDLNFGWEPGLDASLAYRIGAFKAEVRYFGLHDWSESHDSGTSSSGFGINYDDSFFFATNTPADVWADYESKIHSVELNLHWYPIDRFSLLFGFRYFKLDEVMDFYVRAPAWPLVLANKLKTDNEMLGAQLGVQGDFFKIGERFRVYGWAKGGYFKNDYTVEAEVNSTGFLNGDWSADNGDDSSTFFGEVGIHLSYVIFNHFTITAGYQFLYIDKVALAPNQFANSNPFIGSASKMTDSAYYHGATAGITIFW